jgi:mRNA-degrading endonuclease RelE of RelBE toxin-antitoxin system
VPPEPAGLSYTSQALSDLQRLRGHARRFLKQLESLRQRPDRGHLLRSELYPSRSLVLSYESGGYRAVYLYDERSNRCLVYAVDEHATVYDAARRRFPPEPATEPGTET